jgi:hypothetical protein
MKNFSKSTFTISTIIFGFLLIPSFLAAFGEDEGTLPADSFWIIFAKLFYVLRFPTHTLFWTLICKGGGAIFFGGLLINCLFYGLLTERLLSIFEKLRQDNAK